MPHLPQEKTHYPKRNGNIGGGMTNDAITSCRWFLHFVDRDPMEVTCYPSVSHDKILSYYPDAIAALPIAAADDDDRRACRQCLNLDGAQCQAIRFASKRLYQPAPDIPRRCADYAPGPDDRDQRQGFERWPGL
jgi:hypothetical protein